MKAAREWREYLAARRELSTIDKTLASAPKELEGEQKKLDHELKRLDQNKQEWQKAYLVQHERGAVMGARQVPKWTLWIRSVFIGLVVLLLSLPFRSIVLVPIVATVAATLGAYAYFHTARVSPKPNQLYRQQNVQFRENDGGVKGRVKAGQCGGVKVGHF